jgi:hypothetical protein
LKIVVYFQQKKRGESQDKKMSPSNSAIRVEQNFGVYYEVIKRELREDLYMSVGVMKDQKVKLRDLHTSHTLGGEGDWN